MKDKKKISTIYYLAAALFYIAAVIGFVASHEFSGINVMYLCLGSSMLCLGSVNYNEFKKNKKENEEDEK